MNRKEELELRISRLKTQIEKYESINPSPGVLYRIKEYKKELSEAELELIDLESQDLQLVDKGMRFDRFKHKLGTIVLNFGIFMTGLVNTSTDIFGSYGDDPVVKFILLIVPVVSISIMIYETKFKDK